MLEWGREDPKWLGKRCLYTSFFEDADILIGRSSNSEGEDLGATRPERRCDIAARATKKGQCVGLGKKNSSYRLTDKVLSLQFPLN
jgi:hypothetical protein